MGFASFFESLSNAYSGIKSTVSNIFHERKNILHKVRGGFDWFDNEINKLSSIPFVNTLVSGAKDFLQYDTIKSVIQDIDNMAQSSELEAYGGMIDKVISGGLQAGQTIGGAVDTYFSGNQSPPNSVVAGGSRQTASAG